MDTACRVPGVVRDVCCLGEPLVWAGEGLCPDWQVKKRLMCHFTGLQSSCRAKEAGQILEYCRKLGTGQ